MTSRTTSNTANNDINNHNSNNTNSLSPQDHISTHSLLFEFSCFHNSFHLFSALEKRNCISQIIEQNPHLFLIYHITQIRYKLHSQAIDLQNLDSILQSFLYLSPKYQPSQYSTINNHCCNQNTDQLLNESSNHRFWKLHSEIKIQALLKEKLYIAQPREHMRIIKLYFKIAQLLNRNAFDFRHIFSTNDTNAELVMVDIMSHLSNLSNGSSSMNSNPSQMFFAQHSYQKFEEEMNGYLNDIQSAFYDHQNIHCRLYEIAEEMVKRTANEDGISPILDIMSSAKINESVIETNVENHIFRNNFVNVYFEKEKAWKKCLIVQLDGKNKIRVKTGNAHKIIRNRKYIQPIIDGDEDESMIDVQQKVSEERFSSKIASKHKKSRCTLSRGHRSWTDEEDRVVILAINKYGHMLKRVKHGQKGCWSHIEEDDEFEVLLLHRTKNMIRDRCRILQKKGFISGFRI